MIVYVETNFLLELAYLQERCDSCQEILDLARNGTIALVMPVFCAAEARATWHRRAAEHREFLKDTESPIKEIARSRPFRELSRQLREVVKTLVSGSEEARERLENAITLIEEHGTITPLTKNILALARAFEILFALSPPDALVLASVQSHAEDATRAKCFVSQDAKGFATPKVVGELTRMQCKMIANFTNAVAYIRSVLELPS